MMPNASDPANQVPPSPPRGRPTVERVYKINRAIMNAATECFLSCCNYEGASMDAIAAAARVSKVTLYARFQKESLFKAVIQDLLATWWAEEFKEERKPGETLEQRLRDHVRTLMIIGASTQVRAFDRLLSTAPAHLAHSLREVRYNHMVDVLARDIDELASADGCPADDPTRVASDLLAMLAGWFRMESMIRTVSEQESIAFGDHAVDLLMAARKAW